MKLAVFVAVTGIALVTVAKAEGYDPIETRQAGQDLVAADFAGIRAVVSAKGDIKSVANPAKAIARWIRNSLPSSQRAASKDTIPEHGPDIWTDFADFQQRANNLADAADKLAQLANAGDADGVAAQINVVRDACAACHRTYRSGPY